MNRLPTQALYAYRNLAQNTEKFASPLTSLAARLLVAKVFLDSGATKWSAWFEFNQQKYDLFIWEFFCPDPPRPNALQLCDPVTLDYAASPATIVWIERLALTAGILEVVLPVLLIIGLFSRVAAAGLLAMTLFIQFAVFPSWSHWWNPAAWWTLACATTLAFGPGVLSLDVLVGIERSGRKSRRDASEIEARSE